MFKYYLIVKSNKAPGMDGISENVIKHALYNIDNVLTDVTYF